MNSETFCLKACIKSNIQSLIPSIEECEVGETLLTIEEMMSLVDANGQIQFAEHQYQIKCTYLCEQRGVKMYATGDSFIDAYFNLVDRFTKEDPLAEFTGLNAVDYIIFTEKLMKDGAKLIFDIANSTYTWGYTPRYEGAFDVAYETIDSEAVLSQALKVLCTQVGYFNDRETPFAHLISQTERIVWGEEDSKLGTLLKVNASSILDARQRICEFIDHFSKEHWFIAFAKLYYSKVEHSKLSKEPFFFSSYETELLRARLRYMFTSNPTLQTPTSNGIQTEWINIFSISAGRFQIDSTKYSIWEKMIPVVPSMPSLEVKPVGTYTTPVAQVAPFGAKMWHAKCFNCYSTFDVPFWILNNPKEHNDKRVCPCCNKIGINYKKCSGCCKNFFASNNPAFAKCPTCKK